MISLFRDFRPKLFLKVVVTITVFLENLYKVLFINTCVIKVLMKVGELIK